MFMYFVCVCIVRGTHIDNSVDVNCYKDTPTTKLNESQSSKQQHLTKTPVKTLLLAGAYLLLYGERIYVCAAECAICVSSVCVDVTIVCLLSIC